MPSLYALPYGTSDSRLRAALNAPVFKKPPAQPPVYPGSGVPNLTFLGQSFPGAPSIVTNPAPVAPTPSPATTGAPTTAPAIGAGPGVSAPDLKGVYATALKSDPVYQAALQAAKAQRKTVASGFLTQLKQSLIGYGSQEYAHKTIDPLQKELSGYIGSADDLKLDQPFWSSISADPETSFSTLGSLNRQTPRLLLQTKEAVNKANLFYGGHGAQAISDQTYQNQKAYSDADRAIQAQIATDRNTYLASLAGIDDRLAAAAEAAYMRALQAAYAAGVGGGGGGSDGGGGGGGGGFNTQKDFFHAIAGSQGPSQLARRDPYPYGSSQAIPGNLSWLKPHI
jgi:hypothetical protein